MACDYQLTFDSRGKANISSRVGSKVYGAVYVVTVEQLQKLDAHEGVTKGIYKRFPIMAKSDSQPVRGVAYVRTEETPYASPSEDYLSLILNGLAEHGYSEAVIKEVRATANLDPTNPL
jgi:hypothetical protein